MTAYVIVDIDVHDPVGYEEYKKLAPPAIAKYGGIYLARGGMTETLEGDWSPSRLVIWGSTACLITISKLFELHCFAGKPESRLKFTYACSPCVRHDAFTIHYFTVRIQLIDGILILD